MSIQGFPETGGVSAKAHNPAEPTNAITKNM